MSCNAPLFLLHRYFLTGGEGEKTRMFFEEATGESQTVYTERGRVFFGSLSAGINVHMNVHISTVTHPPPLPEHAPQQQAKLQITTGVEPPAPQTHRV